MSQGQATPSTKPRTELSDDRVFEQLEDAIATLEQQRSVLGSGVVDTAILPLRERQAILQAQRETILRQGSEEIVIDVPDNVVLELEVEEEE